MAPIGVLERTLDEPMYAAAEAGRLAGVAPARVWRWLRGYSYQYGGTRRQQRPVVRRIGSADGSYASFLDLVDLLFVKRFLDHGISLQKVRKALNEAAQVLGTSHFARERFFTDGKDLYLDLKSRSGVDTILELLSGGQWVIPDLIRELGEEIVFDSTTELARRWYPHEGNRLVVLDPTISFGRPHVVGKGIATANVYDFYIAESAKIRPVCRWFDLKQAEVRAAVEFEEKLAA